MTATLTEGIVTAVEIEVAETAEFVEQLTEKFGKPTRRRTEAFTNRFGKSWNSLVLLEWNLPGLHVRFDLHPQMQAQMHAGAPVVESASVADSRKTEDEAKKAQELRP